MVMADKLSSISHRSVVNCGLCPKTSRIVSQKMLISLLKIFWSIAHHFLSIVFLKSSYNRFRVTKKLNRFLVTVIFFICFLHD